MIVPWAASLLCHGAGQGSATGSQSEVAGYVRTLSQCGGAIEKNLDAENKPHFHVFAVTVRQTARRYLVIGYKELLGQP